MSEAAAEPLVVVVMGVAGSGKSTVAALLAAILGYEFQEGDLLHPEENIAKMRGGTPLDDAGRMLWLTRVAETIDAWRRQRKGGVISCSALKRSYRGVIIGARRDVALVYLKGSYELIHNRLVARKEHFMPSALLDSQFATLEEPAADERAIIVGIERSPTVIVAEILDVLKHRVAGD
jgi:gluconokinase